MNTSPGSWQGYSQGPGMQWGSGAQQPQSNFGQNGGNMASQPSEPPFVGRYINHIEEVMPREVPMDGRAALFPTQNLEEIFLKAWDRNGTIKTFHYILDPMQAFGTQGAAQEPDMGSMILERLEQLEQRLSEVQQPKTTNNRNRPKGGEENA